MKSNPPVIDIIESSQEEEEVIDGMTEKEREENNKFVAEVYQKISEMDSLYDEAQPILGGRSIRQFWTDGVMDYAVLSQELDDEDDVIHHYQSSISRDKANAFIANLTGKLMRPNVIAQNPDQSIDRVFGRVAGGLTYWAYRQDGWPSETGEQKNARYVHTSVVKGTGLCLDIVTKDGLESEYIPNEEFLIPQFWQPNLQKQPHIARVKMNLLPDEVESLFGDHPRYEYVENQGWQDEIIKNKDGLKDFFTGKVKEDSCTIIYWYKKASPSELRELKKKRKVRSKAKSAIFYNVIINNIALYPVDNLLPYKHGFYPFGKCIFEFMAEPDFFWGNSMPNKCREDKRWKDEWKTLIRFKGKQKALAPMLAIGGNVDGDMWMPSEVTMVPQGVDIKELPGVEGVTQSDIMLMQDVDAEIDRATVSQQQTGGVDSRRETARSAVIRAQASNTLMDNFSRQVAYFMASRAFHISMSLLQLLPKRDIKRIVVPDETLNDGLKGSFEIIFDSSVSKLEGAEQIKRSFEISKQEEQSRKIGQPKDTVMVNPSFSEDIIFYLYSDASAGGRDNDTLRRMDFDDQMQNLLARPDLWDSFEVAQYFNRLHDLDERLLAKRNMQQPSSPMQPNQQAPNSQSVPDRLASAASKATTGEPLPSMTQ